jgi:hypothetical protein
VARPTLLRATNVQGGAIQTDIPWRSMFSCMRHSGVHFEDHTSMGTSYERLGSKSESIGNQSETF